MPAFNFMKAIASKVEDGSKPHTFRICAKRKPPKVGDTLKLYTGMRSKQCRLLRTVECRYVIPTVLRCDAKFGPMIWTIGDRQLSADQMWSFAVNDGFVDVFDMTNWLLATHGETASGFLIAWEFRIYMLQVETPEEAQARKYREDPQEKMPW